MALEPMENAAQIIQTKIEHLRMISQNTHKSIKYNCLKCKDTKWIETETGYKRCDCFEREKAKTLWETFGVKPEEIKKLNEYEPFDKTTTAARDKAVKYIKSFDSIKDTRENGLGLFGQAGAGKTHIVTAIGAALLNREENPLQVIYMPYLEAMRELKANAMDDEYYLQLSSRYQGAKVLIIDDLFKDKVKQGKLIKNRFGEPVGLNEADMKHIYPIINYRYINHLPTIVSSECTPNILLELDEALAGRLLETCGENIVIFQGTEYNFRMKKFRRENNA